MCGSLVFARSSRGPRRLFASASRPRPPGWAAYTGPTRAHCPSLVAAGRPGIDVRRGGTFLVAGEPCRGCPSHWCGARPLCGGAWPDSGALCSLGMAPSRRRGGRARRRSVALPVGAGAYVEARPSGRLDRLVSTESGRFQERMELIEAVQKQDAEEVEVRRPLEAFLSAESGPSRGVCLGLGQWTLDAVVARPIRPCCVESSPYVRHQSGNLDAACRRSSVPVWTSRSVTRTLPCRLAESHNFSPPPSPAIAVSATF